MSLYVESRVTMFLSEVYIIAPIKPCIYLLKTVTSVLSSAYFCGNSVTFILCVKSIEETCEEDESDSTVIHYKLTFPFKI